MLATIRVGLYNVPIVTEYNIMCKIVGYSIITCHCTAPRLSLPLLLSAQGRLAASPGSVAPQPASARCVGREQSIANDWMWWQMRRQESWQDAVTNSISGGV